MNLFNKINHNLKKVLSLLTWLTYSSFHCKLVLISRIEGYSPKSVLTGRIFVVLKMIVEFVFFQNKTGAILAYWGNTRNPTFKVIQGSKL